MKQLRKVFVAAFFIFSEATLAFNCGPHTLTYVVTSANGSPAGIRCVKLEFGGVDHGMPQYELYWYGEGKWGNASYRHVGFGAQNYGVNNPGTGFAADIYGNGETFNGRATNLGIRIVEVSHAPSKIVITGAWNETWSLTQNVQYTALPNPTVCGSNFETYKVRASGGIGPVMGLRCVISDLRYKLSVWYGTGSWGGGGIYKHLGMVLPLYGLGLGPTVARYGQASDLCDSSVGQSCNTFPTRSIIFTPTSDMQGFNLTGAWNENWHK